MAIQLAVLNVIKELKKSGKIPSKFLVHIPKLKDCEDWGKAIFRPALHSGLLPNGQSFGPAAGIILDFGDCKIYHMGDTAINPDIKFCGEFYKPDVALIPIGGRVNLDIDQAIEAAQWLKVKTVIPTHYDLFTQGEVNPKVFKQKIEEQTNIYCIIMEPFQVL